LRLILAFAIWRIIGDRWGFNDDNFFHYKLLSHKSMGMDNRELELLALIKDYIACSKYFCNAVSEEFNTIGQELLYSRRNKFVPKEGTLSTGLYFCFHGSGCYFEFQKVEIDVDFGPNGRCDGFDNWRLLNFSKSLEKKYGALSVIEDVDGAIELLYKDGILIRPGEYPSPHLYYLKEFEPDNIAALR
jgi:hypothetical protein